MYKRQLYAQDASGKVALIGVSVEDTDEYGKPVSKIKLTADPVSYTHLGSHHSWNYYWGGFSQAQIDKLSGQIGREWDGNLWLSLIHI